MIGRYVCYLCTNFHINMWSGKRESNSHLMLGKHMYYHYTITAYTYLLGQVCSCCPPTITRTLKQLLRWGNTINPRLSQKKGQEPKQPFECFNYYGLNSKKMELRLWQPMFLPPSLYIITKYSLKILIYTQSDLLTLFCMFLLKLAYKVIQYPTNSNFCPMHIPANYFPKSLLKTNYIFFVNKSIKQEYDYTKFKKSFYEDCCHYIVPLSIYSLSKSFCPLDY